MNNNTDIIKDKLNILDVVGSYVKLEKAGKTYKGKSPFTHEKTPSFFVSPEKGFFYCFSSGKGGDMFTFIQEIERIDFKEALRILADKAGISLDSHILKKNPHESIQYKILDDITKHYEIHLRKNSKVVEYLLKRGLTKETLIQFRVGFALGEWSDAYDYLTSRKYNQADIQSVGVIINKEGTTRYYDRFRSRVMFPLFDGRSRVVGFSGRIFTDDPDEKGAKYINSPEGPLFDKSAVLYGYHTAKSAMSKAGSCILVEGQFDVLMAQQSGYVNTVAVSGTGLTDTHIAMIKRFTDTVVMAFDSDNAGIKATRRSALAAYRNGMNVRIVSMPEGMDPADLIAHSKEQWDVCITDAEDYIDYRLGFLEKQNLDFNRKKKIIHEDIFTFVYLMKSAMTQDKMLQKIALFLGVSIESVRSEFTHFTPDEDISQLNNVSSNRAVEYNNSGAQKEILYLYNYFLDKKYSSDEELLKKIFKLYTEIFKSQIDEDISNLDETEKNMQLFVFEERYSDSPEHFFLQSVYTMIAEEKLRALTIESQGVLEEVRKAEGKGDVVRIAELQKQHQQLLAVKTDLMNSIQ